MQQGHSQGHSRMAFNTEKYFADRQPSQTIRPN